MASRNVLSINNLSVPSCFLATICTSAASAVDFRPSESSSLCTINYAGISDYTRVYQEPNMPQYIILLYDDPKKFAELSPQEMQEAFKKYHGWGQKMREQGRLTGSNKLTDGAGRVLRGKSPMRVTDGPFTEGKEVLGGYYMFNADSYEHAIELTRDHPQLEYGGTVEVREIQDLSQAARNA
jgi:hypothetical protein